MKRFIFTLLYALILIGVSSCSSDEPAKPDSKYGDINALKSRNSELGFTDKTKEDLPMLHFPSQKVFMTVVDSVKGMETDEEKLLFISKEYPGFRSIQHIYDDAMTEASIVGENKEDYDAFMKKYDCLYFPLLDEDAGAYIPSSDLDIAYLLNANGDVEVAGDTINGFDIKDYETLQKLGRSYYRLDAIPMVSTGHELTLNKNVNCVDPDSKYDTDWVQSLNGKHSTRFAMWRKVIYDKKKNASGVYLHTEFSFRRKTWYGWANHKEKSWLSYSYTSPVPYPGKGSEKDLYKKRFSSHDRDFIIPLYFFEGNRVYYINSMSVNVSVKYERYSHLLNYEYTFPWRATNPFGVRPNYPLLNVFHMGGEFQQ